MDIKSTLEKYNALADYFAPDYERDNPVLIEFKKENAIISDQQTNELIDLLRNNLNIEDKYFVADLLYLYTSFNKELAEALILTAINHKDPSFNRIFIRPCLAALGTKIIADNLAEKFIKVSIEERIGIANLVYWLRPQENGEADKLHKTIVDKAHTTTNLIELYHYKLCYGDRIKNAHNVPENAIDLIKAIDGNKEYEESLFEKLGWSKPI